MYKIRTEFNFEAAHQLHLPYESACNRVHGHSYLCAVTIASETLNNDRMICDFKVLKNIINERIERILDHQFLNDVFEGNTTAEYMSRWICEQINESLCDRHIAAKCICVELNETAKNKAIWEED